MGGNLLGIFCKEEKFRSPALRNIGNSLGIRKIKSIHNNGKLVSLQLAVIERFSLPPRLVHLVLLDGAFVPPGERDGRVLHDGETLAIWPPVAGG